MKYISIDIETTGLDHWFNNILQIALVFEDTNADLPLGKLPHLDLFLTHEEGLNFQEPALKMHTESGLLDEYFETDKVTPAEAVDIIVEWLIALGYSEEDDGRIKFVVAGKNYNAFDRRFLHEIPEWSEKISEHRRVLDPAILFVDWENDDVPPNLSQCLYRSDPKYERDGIDIEVTHDALEDAFDVIRVIRNSQENFVWT